MMKVFLDYRVDYLAEIESNTFDEEGTAIFSDIFYKDLTAFNDEEACRIARRRFCFSSVNPYGEKTTCELKAIYRKGVVSNV